jgi:uncharacterized protein (TIGR02284 family)
MVGSVRGNKVVIDEDAENSGAEVQPPTPALKAELTWAKLYTQTMHKDLVAISTAVGKGQPASAGPAMKKSAEHLHDQLQSANRTVGELSDRAGIRPMPVKSDRGDTHMNPEPYLDRLISVCVDSQKRYEHAALDVGKEYLTRFFNQQAGARQRAAGELQAQRERLGSTATASGSVAGMIDRTAMDFNVVMSMGDTGVVEWCRKDAEAASSEYASALAEDLSPEIRSLLERQMGEIRNTVGGLEGVLREYGGPKS